MRAMLLANELIKSGHKVTIISSSFFHQRKSFRSKSSKEINFNKELRIVLINSSGYKKHISLSRILDHIILSLNLQRFLKKNPDFLPDRVFLGYPPIETSFVIIKWAKKNNIPVMLDVKDNWPENFIDPFPKNTKKFVRLLLLPYFKIAKYIFNNANYISSITKSFINWIDLISNNKYGIKNTNYLIAPLVREKIFITKKMESQYMKFWKQKDINISCGKYFLFIGSLSNAFDFELIYEISNLLISTHSEYFFLICGTGDKYEKLKSLFENSKNVFLFGEIDKYNASFLVRNAIATLAPYQNNPNFKNSIPNKVIESLEHGVPFITCTEGELKSLIQKYKNGIYLNRNKLDISKILKLINNKEYLERLRENASKSYQNSFDFKKTYQEIIFKLTQTQN